MVKLRFQVMSGRARAQWFAVGVVAAACLVLALAAPALGLGYVSAHPGAFAALAVGVLLGELLPVTIPRRGGDEQITISTAFSFALLLVGGLGPAVVAQAAASAVQDVAARKPVWRILFNLGQYALSLAAAYGVLRLVSDAPHVGAPHPFSVGELPAVLLSAAAFFAVNSGVVGMAVAMYQESPVLGYFRSDIDFTALTGSVLLCVGVIVSVAVVYSPVLVPLFALPLLAIYRAGGEAARSDFAAKHDALTGLPNRVGFAGIVAAWIAAEDRRACVLLMDLNRFKDINDSLGHQYGDRLLQEVSARVERHFGDAATVARLGGDEFGVLYAVDDLEGALAAGRRLAEVVRAPIELDEFVIDTEASVGVAMFPHDGRDLETLLQRADVAMYRAKETHTVVALYDEQFDHHSAERLALAAELRHALLTDQIVVWYQPMLDARTGAVSAVEALARWQHPQRGLLIPAAFLNLAERSSLIQPLTRRVLDVALRQVASWHQLDLPLVVSVNVSARVLTDHRFVDTVMQALQDAQVGPEQLKLEVTESAIMTDPVIARSVLSRLDAAGVRISIDDFGTGHSSLAYLAELPVSEVKIDRSFVEGMAQGTRGDAVVSTIIDLGHHLGLTVVAEGAADETTVSQLRHHGCDLIQGHYIRQPAAGEAMTAWLLARERVSR